jgi:hypothetical protein
MRDSNRQDCACGACRGSGWLGFTKNVDGRNLPWSAACYCPAGVYLTEAREPHRQGDPRPIRVNHAPREVYERHIAKADELREQRRAA